MNPEVVGALAWGIVIGLVIGYVACYRRYEYMIEHYFKAGKQAMQAQKRFSKLIFPLGRIPKAGLAASLPQQQPSQAKGTDAKE